MADTVWLAIIERPDKRTLVRACEDRDTAVNWAAYQIDPDEWRRYIDSLDAFADEKPPLDLSDVDPLTALAWFYGDPTDCGPAVTRWAGSDDSVTVTETVIAKPKRKGIGRG